ncbi:exosortase system-associated protein, TIGR04073 family [Nitrosospira sp. Nsp1]|uniref:exosortase system-associated protein, TIGR04073 family n=1 Tax=Nitrosospira sp. Nsp1 TaxID=136547 RepID=UPI00087F7418|nr:exosortase system-associated protein, TIGR04073 family [Nitrosospira sp. Nsp1]SCX63190.1 putative exosortase-associated protein, TIGR04073 family [Nitrosospira sp. Nsp1]
MKNILKSLLLLSATLFFSSQAAAGEDGYFKGVGVKLGHGAMNAVTGVAEVPRNMLYESNDKGIGYGLTTGLFKGIGYGVGRTAAGFIDLATFFIPSKPIIAPGYVWENFRTEPTHFRQWR